MAKPWACPTCRTSVDTLHCPTCGEKALQPKDLTFLGLMTQAFHTLSSIDSRLLHSLQVLMTRPGAITNAYVLGPRKPYIGPFQLFLIVNVVFFAVQAFAESPIFSTSLHSHMHDQDWSAFARDVVAQKLAATHTTLAAYTPVFDHAVDVNARSLVILLVLPFTLLLIPLFATSHRPFVTHLVFALHLLAFLLLCSCGLLLLSLLEKLLGGEGLRSTLVDWATFAVLVAVIATYLYIATRVVYGATGVVRALKVALLAVVIAAAVPGYRFLIFLVTLYST
ncbi:MAG TPA: DUF3667 domain-containing protein [Steroidobacteraceae bacterium]|nr:DUF3667 domain-containing protein [Steroidobacteraceae bacterium]